MSKPFKKILLVTNDPSDTTGAEKTALNLAKQNQASVVLADTIKTPFFAPRYPSLSSEVMYQLAIEAKSKYLDTVGAQFADEGISTCQKVLIGPRTSGELIRSVVENECDLLIRYLKGQSSHANGRFGETAENLIRACPVPVLLTEQELCGSNVLACINLDHGREENQAILENARRLASSPEKLFVLSCWEYSGNAFLIDFIDEGLYEQSKEEAGAMYHKMFDRLCSDYDVEDLDDRVFLMNKNPDVAIPEFCAKNEIGVAVMCSASLNHPLGRKLGSTIERIIAKLPCALMTVKPIGFQTPDISYQKKIDLEVSRIQ